jgi:hypothetical protein
MKRIGKTLQMRAFDLGLLLLGIGVIAMSGAIPEAADTLKTVGGGLCGLALPQIGKWWGTQAAEETVTVTTTTTDPPEAA